MSKQKSSRVSKQKNLKKTPEKKEKILWRFVKPVEGESAYEKYPEMVGKCTGCRICEAVCSFEHFGVVTPQLSAIKVEKNFYNWLVRASPHSVAISRRICLQCLGEPPCMKACSTGAINRSDGAVIIDKEKCTKCGLCIKACPYGAIRFDKAKRELIKCDLCGGDPQCVKWCPAHVLEYVVVKK